MKSKPIEKAMRSTVLDRLIGYFDPNAALRRQRARGMMAVTNNYLGASRTKSSMRKWFTSAKSADADLIPNLEILRQRSRDLVRNQPLAAGAIKTVVSNVVGKGLRMESTIDAKVLGISESEAIEWQDRAEQEYRLWSESKDCDITRHSNMAGLQDLAFRSALENGDSFVILPMVSVDTLPYSTRIQLVEADRVCNEKRKANTNNLVAGIELDRFGATKKIHVLDTHPGALKKEKERWSKVDVVGKYGRRNVIHLFDRKRIGQSRGEPFLASVIDPLKQLGQFTDAELTAAVVSGMFTVFVKTEDGSGSLISGDQINNADEAVRDYELGNGAIIEGIKGDSIETINPGRPNSSFDPFVQAILRQVGVALEIPFEVLIKHFTASYSAARSALLEAWKFFQNRRAWLATNFCQPVYEAFLIEAVSLGRLDAPGFFDDPLIRKAYCSASWYGDGPGSLDPLKEAKAAEVRVDMGLTTLPEEIVAYDGGDWSSKHRMAEKVQAARTKAGLTKEKFVTKNDLTNEVEEQ